MRWKDSFVFGGTKMFEMHWSYCSDDSKMTPFQHKRLISPRTKRCLAFLIANRLGSWYWAGIESNSMRHPFMSCKESHRLVSPCQGSAKFWLEKPSWWQCLARCHTTSWQRCRAHSAACTLVVLEAWGYDGIRWFSAEIRVEGALVLLVEIVGSFQLRNNRC